MKIDQLRLIAYGPFTDLELDFSHGDAAFHLVYGANEAGKSSALRALRNLLFGIPVRTADSFLHPNPKLRIGARLTRSDGQTIAFVRRKGQNKTLRGPDGRSLLADASLVPFLGGVDRDLFEQMFAIDHEDLVQGGEEIISGGGSVGQALFAAGAGLIRLQGFRQNLEAECEDLFKTTGTKPRINSTLSALREARKNQKTARLQVKTWRIHHQGLGDARQRLETVQQDLARLKQEHGLLERIREALPLMARKEEIDTALTAYAGVPELPDDFSEKRREVENTLKIAANDFNRSQKNMAELDDQLAALAVPAKLLQHAAMVEALQYDLGSFKKARQDRPVLEARMRLLYRQASTGLSEAGTGVRGKNGPELELPAALVGEIQELGQAHERLRIRMDTARERCRQQEAEIGTLEDQRKSLATPCEVDALKVVLQSAQDAGPLEKQLAETRSAVSEQERTLNDGLKRQTLWSGDLEELDALACPSKESVDRFEDRLRALSQQLERLQTEKDRKEEELSGIDIELRTIAFSHDLPTEENLTSARALRDTGWHLVRRRLEDRGPSAEEEGRFTGELGKQNHLPDAFEESMRRADQIADRL
nr:AAA family ATPase [Desulfobacterales bacterium]